MSCWRQKHSCLFPYSVVDSLRTDVIDKQICLLPRRMEKLDAIKRTNEKVNIYIGKQYFSSNTGRWTFLDLPSLMKFHYTGKIMLKHRKGLMAREKS